MTGDHLAATTPDTGNSVTGTTALDTGTEPDGPAAKTQWTHGRAEHHPGPVCGADDRPTTKVSDDPHQIDCPDCTALAQIEALPDDATHGDPRVIEMLREATRGAFRKIGGVPVDPTTAAAILTVYQAANRTTRAKLAAMPLDRMVALAWQLIRPHA